MFDLPVVDLHVTGVCNLACKYCFGELDTRSGIERRTLVAALSFAEHVQARAIEFGGGEPLLYKDLDWAVNEAKSRGFELILRTNGYYVPKRRAFVAASFNSVGISLDGDAHANDLMRPLKGLSHLTKDEKFQIPLDAIQQLKRINPSLHVVLASVATRLNAEGLVALARILASEKFPIDLWKVYHFVANNFRAREHESEFALDLESLFLLKSKLEREVKKQFPLVCRTADQVDCSCLIVNSVGDVLLGSMPIGNVLNDSAECLSESLEIAGGRTSILQNKSITYRTIIPS